MTEIHMPSGDSTGSIVGVDIGGANLKYADCDGRACSRSYQMWRRSNDLAGTLLQDLQQFTAVEALAVTMTGELADCYVDRQIGVQHIIQHAKQASESLGVARLSFYGVNGQFYSAATAQQNVDLIAAANWHALAKFVAENVVSNGLLIDIGSTTTDIVPIRDAGVATDATSDFDRLVEGSLVYVGCRRTAVCALVDLLTYQGHTVPVMNELFATIDDAQLLLGHEQENVADLDSADGKPRTQEFAANRLARMIGLDRRQVSIEQARELAIQVVDAARHQIGSAVAAALRGRQGPIVISGHGAELLELPTDIEIISLQDRLGKQCARSAPAYAVARLCQALGRVSQS